MVDWVWNIVSTGNIRGGDVVTVAIIYILASNLGM